MDRRTASRRDCACPARGQIGRANIGIHSRRESRYIRNVCGRTFVARRGTVFYRRRLPQETIVRIVTLLAYGCPRQAIVAAFEVDERRVKSLGEAAGEYCQQVEEQLVERLHDLGQVQPDEIRAKIQGCNLWMAMAIRVHTRLWLSGVLSVSRDTNLLVASIQKVRCCAWCRPLVFCLDRCQPYGGAIHCVFREPIRDGKPGRPHLRLWDGIDIAQVVKRYARKRVVGVTRRVVQGSQADIEGLLRRTLGGGVITTAYIERLNATFRARITALVHRGRALARQTSILWQAKYLVVTVYNFCSYHHSLRIQLYLPKRRRRWSHGTPAIAAGITDHRASVQELLPFWMPPPLRTPLKRERRRSNAMAALMVQWCS